VSDDFLTKQAEYMGGWEPLARDLVRRIGLPPERIYRGFERFKPSSQRQGRRDKYDDAWLWIVLGVLAEGKARWGDGRSERAIIRGSIRKLLPPGAVIPRSDEGIKKAVQLVQKRLSERRKRYPGLSRSQPSQVMMDALAGIPEEYLAE
jgi:hypothetical protein